MACNFAGSIGRKSEGLMQRLCLKMPVTGIVAVVVDAREQECHTESDVHARTAANQMGVFELRRAMMGGVVEALAMRWR